MGFDTQQGKALSYKVYTATLTQSGTNAPVPTILENTIGDIVWSRSDVGVYSATLAGAFPNASKVYISVGLSGVGFNVAFVQNSNSIGLQVFFGSAGTPFDNYLVNNSIEIRVYP